MDEVISVIVPAYNAEPYIVKCLDSIIAQTYHNLEIILVDDGSTDMTGQICNEYAERDSRVKVIHQENQGLVRSRKVGIHAASGKYVGFVDSDDWIDTGMYEHLYRSLREADAQAATSGYIYEFPDGRSVREPGYLPAGVYHPKEDVSFCRHMILSEEKLLWGINPMYWCKLFEREMLIPFLEQVDDRITYGEDSACVYPCIAFARTVSVTNACFYHYQVRNTSMSKTPDEKYLMRINLLYLAMKRSFEGHPFASYLTDGMNAFVLSFILENLDRLVGIHTECQVPRFCWNSEGMTRGNKTILYGAGVIGQDCYQHLKTLNLHKDILWADQNYVELQKQGLPVLGPQTLMEHMDAPIIIAVKTRPLYERIRKDLLDMGVDGGRISWAEPHMCF